MGVWCVIVGYVPLRNKHSNLIYNRDTVGSIGVLRSKTLPFTNSNSSIKTFRHALSLDEVRFFSFTHNQLYAEASHYSAAPNSDPTYFTDRLQTPPTIPKMQAL